MFYLYFCESKECIDNVGEGNSGISYRVEINASSDICGSYYFLSQNDLDVERCSWENVINN